MHLIINSTELHWVLLRRVPSLLLNNCHLSKKMIHHSIPRSHSISMEREPSAFLEKQLVSETCKLVAPSLYISVVNGQMPLRHRRSYKSQNAFPSTSLSVIKNYFVGKTANSNLNCTCVYHKGNNIYPGPRVSIELSSYLILIA